MPRDISSVGRFSLMDYFALVLLVPLILVIAIYLMNISYSFVNSFAAKSGADISYVTDRQYQMIVSFDDLSIFLYAVLNLGVLLASLSIPVDRDSALFMFLILVLFGMFMYMTSDMIVYWIDRVVSFIAGDPTFVPMKNLPQLSGAVKIMPIITMIISILLMYMRATRDTVRGV